jgi:hypothetical protein
LIKQKHILVFYKNKIFLSNALLCYTGIFLEHQSSADQKNTKGGRSRLVILGAIEIKNNIVKNYCLE